MIDAERDALQLAIESSLQGESPQSIIQRAKVYYGFLSRPEGISEMTAELQKQVEAMLTGGKTSEMVS